MSFLASTQRPLRHKRVSTATKILRPAIEALKRDFDIFRELGRTVQKGMILVLNEDGHRYPRFYRYPHAINGFKIVATRKARDGVVLIHSVEQPR